MHWFFWFEQILAHMCSSHQHEASIGEIAQLPQEMGIAAYPARPHPLGGCMGGLLCGARSLAGKGWGALWILGEAGKRPNALRRELSK